MKMDNRQARRAMEKMGINQVEMPDVEEVVIITKDKELHLAGAAVTEVNFQGNRIFQVTGEVEEVEREKRSYNEEDVLLVQQQANVTRERAISALQESDGEVARAILRLTT
ncbi:MAG TPA: nascent polypeptide-associated complex protein [Nitrososphaerales archaeon]|nr:nascent polypeptide-associated complex protein [Nitrososphaerales archaeon]